jgi:hypothetical protein
MDPDLAVPERRALFSLLVGTTGMMSRDARAGQVAALIEKGFAEVNNGKVCATEAGRQWLRQLLRGPEAA